MCPVLRVRSGTDSETGWAADVNVAHGRLEDDHRVSDIDKSVRESERGYVRDKNLFSGRNDFSDRHLQHHDRVGHIDAPIGGTKRSEIASHHALPIHTWRILQAPRWTLLPATVISAFLVLTVGGTTGILETHLLGIATDIHADFIVGRANTQTGFALRAARARSTGIGLVGATAVPAFHSCTIGLAAANIVIRAAVSAYSAIFIAETVVGKGTTFVHTRIGTSRAALHGRFTQAGYVITRNADITSWRTLTTATIRTAFPTQTVRNANTDTVLTYGFVVWAGDWCILAPGIA